MRVARLGTCPHYGCRNGGDRTGWMSCCECEGQGWVDGSAVDASAMWLDKVDDRAMSVGCRTGEFDVIHGCGSAIIGLA